MTKLEVSIKFGHICFGICMMTIGIHQLCYADFRTVILPPWPSWRMNPEMAAYLTGVGLISTSVLFIFSIKGKEAALVLGSILLLILVSWHLPYLVFIQPHKLKHLGIWAEASKCMALSGGAFVVAGSFIPLQARQEKHSRLFSLLQLFIRLGPIMFAITMIEFGIDHFLYTDHISTLVPAWIPQKVFWTYFSGAALASLGTAILFKVQVKWAALLLGLMIFLWVFVLHIPRAVADPYIASGNEIVSAADALGFSGIAFIIASMHSSQLAISNPSQ